MARKNQRSTPTTTIKFDKIFSTNVLVIGNGPSAITLSFLLSGHWPHYSPEDIHCNNNIDHNSDYSINPNVSNDLHDRLLYYCSLDCCDHHDENNFLDSKQKLRSLMECDLKEICYDFQNSNAANPVSIMMDQLQHPNADFGECFPSTLKWTYRPDRHIDHIVIGSACSPGGIWHAIAKACSFKSNTSSNDDEVLTLSRRSLMQLPVLPIYDDNTQKNSDELPPDTRIPYRTVANYYRQYVNYFGLDKYFHNHCRATCLDWDPISKCFIVDAICKISVQQKYRVRYIAQRVVLAQGTSSSPRILNITGETLPFVLHSLMKIDLIVRQTQLLPCWRIPLLSKSLKYLNDPVLIVGSGLSAADALISLSRRCQRYPLRIIHIFRKSINDRSLIFNRLATNESNYPEYHKVFQRMKETAQKNIFCLACLSNYQSSTSKQSTIGFEYYQAYQECILTSIQSSNGIRTATIEFTNKNKADKLLCSHCRCSIGQQPLTIRISFALILIGSNPQFNFVSENIRNQLAVDPSAPIDNRMNPIDIDPFTHELRKIKGLYAIGPLVGDNFVRYVQGGALAAANHIYNQRQKNIYNENSFDDG